jgi:predicted metal-dependent HD superfamily phosphohydrolase
MLDEARWKGLLNRLGAKGENKSYFDVLVAAYSEPNRAYHNMDHISECLCLFDSYNFMAENPDEVEIAIWCHDVVYDTRTNDNELRSASWAVEMLLEVGVEDGIPDSVRDLIIATRHDGNLSGGDAKFLADIDLSVLGKPEDEFDADTHKVRAEFQWIPEPTYRENRIAILEGFLNRASIYYTQPFIDAYEVKARNNISRNILRLRGGD